MQTLLLPAARPGTSLALATAAGAFLPKLASDLRIRRPCCGLSLSPRSSLSSPSPTNSSLFSLSLSKGERHRITFLPVASAPSSPPFPSDDTEQAKLAQVAKRLEITGRYFKRLGSFGFWAQLICTVVSAVILSFSIIVTGKITSPVTFYSTAAGIAAAFISVFWSFGYIRLSERLRKTAYDPSKAPPRADVVKSLKNGIAVNLLGMGAAILGMQATVGLLVAKALTTSATPYYQGVSPGYSPVLALDVFLVQASGNTILSHFLGLVSSLELLRSVTEVLYPSSTRAAFNGRVVHFKEVTFVFARDLIKVNEEGDGTNNSTREEKSYEAVQLELFRISPGILRCASCLDLGHPCLSDVF